MANETTTAAGTTSIGTSIPVGIDGELITEVRESLTMVPLTDFRPLREHGGVGYSFPRLTTTVALTAITSGTAEADAQAATTLVTAVATATAATKAAAVLQSWISNFASAVNWKVEVPKILGRAAADLMDVDAASLLSGGSNTVGTTAIRQQLSDLRSAGVTLKRIAKNAADGAVYMLAPIQVDDVDSQLMAGTGVGLSTMFTRTDLVNWYGMQPGSSFLSSYRGTLFGRPVFVSVNVPDMNGTTDHGGALFVPKAAIGGVYAWLPTMHVDSQSVNLKSADSYLVSACYAFVEKFDSMLVTIIGKHV